MVVPVCSLVQRRGLRRSRHFAGRGAGERSRPHGKSRGRKQCLYDAQKNAQLSQAFHVLVDVGFGCRWLESVQLKKQRNGWRRHQPISG
ncbi:hypothetical protein HBI56_066550 [Parastagonospora nodorum]|uniref:Uncharacterized protein n=1 Tax=Phaeosphaeria nodorum (strain SN15 / ATCC MYA-4574 / FGSC 10173) TaxID=321614 RepID=A0A7U2ENH1_PHANO|nr:hypothetical protein HBH56_001140 [Parastagonospora nodorum]QRC90101.1 hypothetical protein JI435_095200 [Parastagonospora nodorum SN15]KAH3938058.1 hypothetical protein HBH54_001150 [Parastagonospora nodorum]KAH3940965.1 hypothetical protein HBH53_210450 [Parastagonospora nodorum]KAH3958504.1 hypothetical protein HBH51_208980 [Parastagonospora nodorum]